MSGTVEDLGRLVRERREELELTQQEAATRADISMTTWRSIEKGRESDPRGLTLTAMARALEWPPTALRHFLAHGTPIAQSIQNFKLEREQNWDANPDNPTNKAWGRWVQGDDAKRREAAPAARAKGMTNDEIVAELEALQAELRSRLPDS